MLRFITGPEPGRARMPARWQSVRPDAPLSRERRAIRVLSPCRSVALLGAIVMACSVAACGNDDEGFNWDNTYAVDDGPGGVTGTGGGAGGGNVNSGTNSGGVPTSSGSRCPPRESDQVTYISEDITFCDGRSISCRGNEVPFNSDCGCGCVARVLWCPDEPDAFVLNANATNCAGFGLDDCLPGATLLGDECGCRCLGGEAVAPTCEASKLVNQQGAAFANGEACAFLVVCTTATAEAAVTQRMPLLSCDSAPHPACAVGTARSCVGALDVLAERDVDAACALSLESGVSRIVCSASP